MANYLTPDEFADRLPGVTGYWVRRELKAGRIRGSKIGSRWFVPEDALDELVANASNQASA